MNNEQIECLEAIKKADAVDRDIASGIMYDLVADENVKTYKMWDEISAAYINGNEDFRKGMDAMAECLVWKNVKEIAEEIAK